MNRPTTRRGSRGQSLVEFGLILPVLLTLFGGAVDVARVYQGWITLEGAARNAAEYAATKSTTSGEAQTAAQTVVCTETQNLPGFVAPGGTPTSCTTPSVTVTYAKDTSASSGASTSYPIVTVTVRASLPFRTLFAYPLFTQNGAWTLGATETYTIQQGRP